MKIKIKNDVLVDVPDDLSLMTPYILLEQEDWFESEIEFARLLLQPGMKVIDVGANYGAYALTAAKLVGACGSVLAFEPASKTADYLRSSIELNSFANVRLFQCALSDHDGEASLSLSENAELNTLQQTAGITSETVRLRTLDDCLAESVLGPIDFFKLDAEGEEVKILDGAINFLKQQSPLIMFELKHCDEVNVGLIKKLESLGFRIYALAPGLNMLAPFDATASIDPYQLNLFACKEDRAEILEQRGLLATSADSELPQHHPDKNLWLTFLKEKTYGNHFIPHYDHLRENEAGDWPIYRQALNDYVSSHLPDTLGKRRLAFLMRSLAALTLLLDEKATTYSRLCTWARVATEAGKRGIATNITKALVDTINAGQLTIDVSEPFLPISSRYDSLDPASDPTDWCLSSVIEASLRLHRFSSYFSGDEILPLLEKLTQSRYQSTEMERRRQLVRIRSGIQQAPERCTALLTANQNNLNAEFWFSEQSRHAMTDTSPPQLPLDQSLQQAIAHHQAGRLQEAEQLYRAILQTQPNHPDANHNLGVIAVQVKQPAAGLPHFLAALEANPAHGQYWLSYIDALLQAGQTETAKQVLAHSLQMGLQGEAVEALAKRIEGGVPTT